jgi:ketosteroid isomerase-like protein
MTLSLRPACCALLFILSLAAFPATPARSQDKPPDQLRTLSRDELDVIKVLTAQEKAWNRGDIEAYATGYKDSPDTLFIGHQISRGYAQTVLDYKRNYPTKDAMGTLAFADLEPKVLDEHYAIVTGAYHLNRIKKFGGAAEGLFSLVLEKTDKGWKIILDHTT